MLVISLEHSKYWSAFTDIYNIPGILAGLEMKRWKVHYPCLPGPQDIVGETNMSAYKDHVHSSQPNLVQLLIYAEMQYMHSSSI